MLARHLYTERVMSLPSTSRQPVAAVQSVDRALQVLEILAKLQTAGVTEIAAEIGVHKSTVSRLIAVLESRGFVEQLTDRGKYQLGFSIVRLAGSTTARMDLVKQSQDICDQVAEKTGETTNIAILDGDRIINVVESVGRGEIALRSWVGQSNPAHATSSGKILLAALPSSEVRARVGRKLESYTPATVTDFGRLCTELEAAREHGWAPTREELETGLNAVAAPIRDHNGSVIAALSISGPAYRLEQSRFEEVAQVVVGAATQISRRIGYTG